MLRRRRRKLYRNWYSLNLYGNQIGDPGVAALADACARGALASIKQLYLSDNAIGDTGMTAFAEAIKPVSEGGSGALPMVTELQLWGNMLYTATNPRVDMRGCSDW